MKRHLSIWVRRAWVGLPLLALVKCAPQDTLGESRQPVTQFPLNLVQSPEGLDPNQLLLNPIWAIQAAGSPDGGSVPPPDASQLCAPFTVDNGAISLGTPPCTNDSTTLNLQTDVEKIVPGLCEAERGNELNGHLNWETRPITVTGILAWETNDDNIWCPVPNNPLTCINFGHDNDINYHITPIKPAPRLPLMPDQTAREPNAAVLAGFDYLKIEFDQEETVNQYDTPFWTQIRQFQDTPNNKVGITTGLFNIDGVHTPEHTEIPPAWAFSANIDRDRGTEFVPGSNECRHTLHGADCVVDKWAAFVRGFGNEGQCASRLESLDFDGLGQRNSLTVRYPWNGQVGSNSPVTVVHNEEKVSLGPPYSPVPLVPGGILSINPVQGQFIDVTFDTSGPRDTVAGLLSNVAADLTFVYGSAQVFDLKRIFSAQGGWVDANKFLVADFTGDGRPDVAHAFNDDGQISIDVYRNMSDGTFSGQERWANQQGGWEDEATFMAADFNGDGATDIAYAFKDDSSGSDKISIDVHRFAPNAVNGTSPGFLGQDLRWISSAGGWSDSAKFVAQDFTGDHRPDIAYAFKDTSTGSDRVSIDVYQNSPNVTNGTQPGFIGQARWTPSTGIGDWADTAAFTVADFTGDGRPDIAYAFKDGSSGSDKISIDVYENTPTGLNGGPGFSSSRWTPAGGGGGWQANQHFLAGDFTGDGKADIAYVFRDQPDLEVSDMDGNSADYPPRISIDVYEQDPTQMAFLPFARWTSDLGGWVDDRQWMAGDLDLDCALDPLMAFKTDGTVSLDSHRNLDVPHDKTVGFDFVPPDVIATTCNQPNIGQARGAACNPNLVVTNNAPQTYAVGRTAVRWTVTDSQTGQTKNATQNVTVFPDTDPSCMPAGLTALFPFKIINPGFDLDVDHNGVPDNWHPGGTGTLQLLSGGFDGRSYKLVPNPSNSYGVSADSDAAVIRDAQGNIHASVAGQKVLLTIAALTTGSLNLAEIEGNFWSNPQATGPTNGGFPAFDLRGSPGQWAVFSRVISLNAGTVSARFRIRARGNGSITYDDVHATLVQ